MTTKVNVQSLTFADAKTYLFASAFIMGNIIFPQLAHLIPQGGFIFLPIYFFTLIGAYKYGLRVGLLTAILSPLVNNLLFGMPPMPMLPIILIKSTLLAVAAAYFAQRAGKISLWAIVAAVLSYQLVGAIAEWVLTQSIVSALQDLRLGYPGIILQIAGGYLLLKLIDKR